MQVMRITYEEPSGTTGASIAGNAYSQHPLNTVSINTIPGAGLSGNQITLAPGLYDINATCAKPYGFAARCALRSTASGAILVEGVNNGPAGVGGGPTVRLNAPVLLNAQDTLELCLWADTAASAFGSTPTGTPLSTGNNEVYAEVVIRKVS